MVAGAARVVLDVRQAVRRQRGHPRPDRAAGDVKGIRVCRQGRRDASELMIDERVDARQQTYYWLGFRRNEAAVPEESDLAAVRDGEIAVTPLHLDLTERSMLKKLETALA